MEVPEAELVAKLLATDVMTADSSDLGTVEKHRSWQCSWLYRELQSLPSVSVDRRTTMGSDRLHCAWQSENNNRWMSPQQPWEAGRTIAQHARSQWTVAKDTTTAQVDQALDACNLRIADLKGGKWDCPRLEAFGKSKIVPVGAGMVIHTRKYGRTSDRPILH